MHLKNVYALKLYFDMNLINYSVNWYSYKCAKKNLYIGKQYLC